MVEVAIGYGGPQAKGVAEKLRSFLKDENIDVFLASPNSHDILHGTPQNEQIQLIHRKFLECNIIIYVCHEETPTRAAVIEEMNFIRGNVMSNKIIIFSKSDDCIPEQARELWRPLHFTPEKPEESFVRLLNEIFRQYIRISEPMQTSMGGL